MIDITIIEITLRSLFISGTATIISTLWGIPIALFLALKKIHGKFLIKSLLNTLIGIPTVALGLILYLIFSKNGPLGFLQLLYTPTAIIIGQSILITPIIISFTINAIESIDIEIIDLARTLGASESQASLIFLKEALNGILLAIMASFNRAISELGLVLIVGGNISGLTDVLTTTIANETAKGNIAFSIKLAIILLALTFGINLLINILQKGKK